LSSSLYSAIDFYLKADTINKVHSPYLYALITAMLEFDKSYYDDGALEALRAEYHSNNQTITFEDYGAGPSKQKTAKLSKLAKTSVSNKWKCRLLRNLVLFHRAESIVEFGTNLGISTAYLRMADKRARLITVEAADELMRYAKKNFKRLGYEAEFKTMTFDDYLGNLSLDHFHCDFFYLDGDHSYENTLRYFQFFWENGAEEMMLVLDDINWSAGMRAAWEEIKEKYKCYSVDIYKMGIVVKRPDVIESLHRKIVPRVFKPWQFGFFS